MWRPICGGAPSCKETVVSTQLRSCKGTNHTPHKDVFVTCRRDGTPDRSPWCNHFKEKRAKNKGACESTQHGHVCRMQLPLMHYKRFSWTPYSKVLRIHCTFQCKVPETEEQNQDVAADHGVSVAAQSESCAGTSVKMQRKIFLTFDNGTPNSRDSSYTGCSIWAPYSTVSYSHSNFTDNFHSDGSPSSHRCTPKSPAFSNFIIFFFTPFVDMGPLLSPFMRRYSLNATLLLLPFR